MTGSGLELSELASRSLEMLQRAPELRRDLDGVKELGEAASVDSKVFVSYWRKNPVAAWCGGSGKGRKWFRVEADRLVPRLPIAAGQEEAFTELTRELVDYRLAQYQADVAGQSFTCKLISNKRDPIRKLPSRKTRDDIPSGELDVRLPDGSVWSFRLMKEFCNVARPRFFRSPYGWCVEPEGQVVEMFPRSGVVAYPSLRAAAGAVLEGVEADPEPEVVALPVRSKEEGLFAVRAAGDSMDGGKTPIHDGDWLVFKHARGAGLGAIEGRVSLLQTDVAGDYGFQIKRVVRDGTKWVLRSDNPEREDFDTTATTTPIATLVEQVRPEDLAPAVGTVLEAEELRSAFGFEDSPRTGRMGGHLFVVIGDGGELVTPDRVHSLVSDLRPGETVFVLAPVSDGAWRYCGVGRLDDQGLWGIPEVDF